MNCFTAHFQTLFQYFFGTFHIVLSIYFVHFIRIFLPYSLQSCILFTSDAANFIPDTIILKFLSPAQFEKILKSFCPSAKIERQNFSTSKKYLTDLHGGGGGGTSPPVTKRVQRSSRGDVPPVTKRIFRLTTHAKAKKLHEKLCTITMSPQSINY